MTATGQPVPRVPRGSAFIEDVFVDYFASVWEPLETITFLSLFEYYDPTQALVSGQANVRSLAILFVVGAVTATAGLIAFTRRDLPA